LVVFKVVGHLAERCINLALDRLRVALHNVVQLCELPRDEPVKTFRREI
jgi:hypothetical protein